MSKQVTRILVVAAHPDDEVLGCGATMARHIVQGDSVKVLILGTGIAARVGVVGKKLNEELIKLRESAMDANRSLGVLDLVLLNFPDNRFDSVPLLDIIQSIEKIVRGFKPHIIYTHHHADVNIDHRKASEAIQAVTRPMVGSSIQRVLAFEVASATDWNFRQTPRFLPNYFVDVTGTIEQKLEAVRLYKGELREFPHPRSVEYLKSLATVRGGQSGMLASEAFELVYMREGTR